MTFMSGLEMGKYLCDAMGLDATKVARLQLDCVIGNPAHVMVDMWVDDTFAETATKTFVLTEVVK